MAFSPPSEYSPFTYIRKPNIPVGNNNRDSHSEMLCPETNVVVERRNSANRFAVGVGANGLSDGLSRLLPRQSYDNLQDLVKERPNEEIMGEFDDINSQCTQSLPATPITTPLGTPQGSPRSPRHSLSHDSTPSQEVHCTLPWFYPGFLTANSKSAEATIVCRDMKRKTSSEEAIPMASLFPGAPSYIRRNSRSKRSRKFSITNRDMNFLAPTSM